MVSADRYEYSGYCARCKQVAFFSRELAADEAREEIVSDCCGWPRLDPATYADAGEL